ncbi:tRNA pseudouridine(55) synthase TruB [Geobacter grbiciae]|uniref:tRNA pseudouridine(55) synthase TruB n=1 Tax=Geobacter grbiciae TaxID=155042 RepID=UPI001C014718|nr:tRNA pseudouridine(55) synthase TruB [Geobacter grbiciae]MBT1075856.1 tRNA pseudouridine(55) synthase TruB [Geobacter grbiciae]
MDGFIVIDKPAGLTSHDIIARVRRILGQKKAGHTGTLDPFATGVLPVAMGEGTKAIPFLDEAVKEYRATMVLGAATDTQDCTGRVEKEGDWTRLSVEAVREVFGAYIGKSKQIPPMYSAVKQGGVPLYRLARKGHEVEREPRDIEIHSLIIDRMELPRIEFTVSCSRGTYVRTLAHDMGERLGCGAHLSALRRTRSGPFDLSRAVTLDELASIKEQGAVDSLLLAPNEVLGHFPEIELSDEEVRKVYCGVPPRCHGRCEESSASQNDGKKVRLVQNGKLLAVAEIGQAESGNGNKSLRLIRVFN